MIQTSILLLALTAILFFGSANGLAPQSRFLGIWKLVSDCLPSSDPDATIRSQLYGRLVSEDGKAGNNNGDVLLKLNPDGTFKQCDEGDNKEGRWISGCWSLCQSEEGREQIKLAFHRRYYGPQFDLALLGEIFYTVTDEQQPLTICGQVEKGKFMYPPKHPLFFESTLIHQERLGNFTLQQLVATSSVVQTPAEEETDGNDHIDSDNGIKFQVSDFYDQEFIMTIEPLASKTLRQSPEYLNLPVDIRSMPITFYQNNTFQAWGVNKILRGRFRITRSQELAFDVSLFGAGRSSPGSVFSEGIGLTHEDKRSYQGIIQESNDKLYVQGSVTFGTDLGSDARPEPCGKFFLMPVTETDGNLSLDDSNDEHGDDDKVSLDSVFE